MSANQWVMNYTFKDDHVAGSGQVKINIDGEEPNAVETRMTLHLLELRFKADVEFVSWQKGDNETE